MAIVLLIRQKDGTSELVTRLNDLERIAFDTQLKGLCGALHLQRRICIAQISG